MTDARSLIVDHLRYAAFDAEERGERVKISSDLVRIIIRLIESDAEENLSVAAATSPLSGETRGEAAGWISVEDRLPEEYTHVLVCTEHSVDYPDDGEYGVKKSLVREGYWSRGFDGGKGRGWNLCIQPDMAKEIGGVTHWMPLPEPPEGYKNEID